MAGSGRRGVVLGVVLAVAVAASGQELLFWDFENVTSAGSVSTAAPTRSVPTVSATFTQNDGGPAENFGAPYGIVFLTRWFGTNHPYVEITVAEPVALTAVTFQHLHNHNPGFPTYPSYWIQLQIDTGGGWTDIGAPVLADTTTSGSTATVNLGGHVLPPGTSRLRWDPRGLSGVDTNTEFFALNDVVLEGQDHIPVPAARGPGLAVLAAALALAGAILVRRRLV